MEISGRFVRPTEEIIARFRQVTVADVGEAMEGSNLMQLAPVVQGARVVGPATTCATPPGQNLALQVALEVARPGDVIVASALGTPTALWGMIATVSARVRGVAAAVVDGCARDIADIREAGFPVWSAAVSPRGARKDVFGAVNAPLVCCGVLVHPGDLVLADDDGVAVVPQDRIEDVLLRAEDWHRREEEMLPRLRAGATPFELLGLADVLAGHGVTLESLSSGQELPPGTKIGDA